MFQALISILDKGISAGSLAALALLLLVGRVLPRLIDRLPDIISALADAQRSRHPSRERKDRKY
jgi:hypothetical protein